MALTSVAASLRAFGPTTLVVRAVDAVLRTLGSEPARQWVTVSDAAAAVGAPVEASEALAEDPGSVAMLRVGAAIDGADRALARALSRQVPPDDALVPQAEDAILKLLMFGWLHGATGGTLQELASGRNALLTWAAVDVALPLGGSDLAWLLREHRTQQTIRLVSLCGEAGMDRVQHGVDALLPAAKEAVGRAAARVDELALALAPFVPGVLAARTPPSRQTATRIALQGDRLPLYKWFTARIAAEHAAMRARASETER